MYIMYVLVRLHTALRIARKLGMGQDTWPLLKDDTLES